jgi:hypothetical protein
MKSFEKTLAVMTPGPSSKKLECVVPLRVKVDLLDVAAHDVKGQSVDCWIKCKRCTQQL